MVAYCNHKYPNRPIVLITLIARVPYIKYVNRLLGQHLNHDINSDNLTYQAELYRMRKEYAKAEPLFLESVQRLEQALGPMHER